MMKPVRWAGHDQMYCTPSHNFIESIFKGLKGINVVLLVSSRRPDNVSHFLSIILSLFPFLVIKLNVLSLS